MRLWDKGGELDTLVARFTVGDDPEVDLAWAWHDVIGSAAHVWVQRAAGLIDESDEAALLGGLATILAEIERGELRIRAEDEDIHTAVEQRLGDLIGPVAGKLHTGRSRNDQVLTDLRLWMLEELDASAIELADLIRAFLDFGASAEGLALTGYTHTQRAMPSSWSLWAAGFAGALLDTWPLFSAAEQLVSRCPLGSAAGYGSPLALDRDLAARLLGFARVEEPVTSCQLTRGLVESAVLAALGAALTVIHRFAQDVVLYSSAEFGLLKLPERLTTGSSIMPQKRNPDVAELLRAQVHRLRACQREIEDLVCLPSGYHRDVQATKAPLLRGLRLGREALRVASLLVRGIEPRELPQDPELFATAEAYRRASAADRPFREVYREVALELRAGTFRPGVSPPAPSVDLAALAARIPEVGRDRRPAWRLLLA